jgi:quercetin dioxygenase-like cupin family protein
LEASVSDQDCPPRKPLLVRPEQGRQYSMGRMRATFLADGAQTACRYSLFEWWLEPRTRGPGEHANPEDHIFYVLAGTLSLCLDGEWMDAPRGSYAVIPGGIAHDFENRGADPCGFLTINVPGGFEQDMPALVQWFADNPPAQIAAQTSGKP